MTLSVSPNYDAFFNKRKKMHNQNPIYEIAIFTVKPEFINQMNDIRQGLRKVLQEFKGLISINTLQPINSNRVYADIAQWQTLKDAQVVAQAFEDGDERFLPYIKTLEDLKFMGHFMVQS